MLGVILENEPTVWKQSEDMTLSSYWRQRIVSLWSQGQNISSIVRILRAEGTDTTWTTVRKWIFRWQEQSRLEDKPRCGRVLKITSEIAEYLDQQLEDDDELSSVELQRLVVRKFAVEISPPTIRRYLRTSLQWTVVRTQFGPMISEKNRSKHMEFARMCMDTNDELDNVIWTDESSVQSRRHSQTMRVKIGKERQLKPQAKHTLKVHVWAGISNRGATKICIFDQTMDATLYIEILRNFLLPFIEKKFQGSGYRFMQDNDSKHTSKKAKEFYEQEGINWWPTPASSADINPIERVWRELKYYLARHVKPLSKKELVKGICLFRKQRMTPAKCARYIAHTHDVLPKIIEKEGGITGE